MNSIKYLVIIILIIGAFFLGYIIKGKPATDSMDHNHEISLEEKIQEWTCSMHPQIRQPKPGKCPLCGMDLIPVASESGKDEVGPNEIKLSEKAKKLAEVEVVPVKRKFVTTEIRMVGKVDYDETRMKYITARFPGRLDRLYVDYTGIPVKEGDHLVYIYSPDLVVGQSELLQALKILDEAKKGSSYLNKNDAEKSVDLSRKKLELWGLTKDQIKDIEARGETTNHMTIYSPMSGIVIHKNAVEGMYVDTGTRIYTIADLSKVWVMLDAYESDIALLRYGQKVEFQTEAYPGEIFKGQISFIEPVLNAETRTVKVRVNVDNSEGKIKPEMFVRAVVKVKLGAHNKVVAEELAGKWISPMHPEIIKNSPGTCDICGMPLVRTESLGYVSEDDLNPEIPLVIPISAPLITGIRALVYVQSSGKEGVYEGREIVLGPKAGDYYIVEDGLSEGELVVVNGNFKIDSAVQILAKPSMMSPEGMAPTVHHHNMESMENMKDMKSTNEIPMDFKTQLDNLFTAYFTMQQFLSRDKYKETIDSAKEYKKNLDNVDMNLLGGDVHMTWMKELSNLKTSIETILTAKDISKAREGFATLSETMAVIAEKFGTSGKQSIIKFHCPMAFDNRGADWLQNKTGVENPFFGSAMFSCGDQTKVIIENKKE